jgi:hypothetical protein
MVGYAVERRNDREEERRLDNGVAFRVYKEFLSRLSLSATMIHWGDEIHYSATMQRGLYEHPFSIVMERIRTWNEFNFPLLHRYK